MVGYGKMGSAIFKWLAAKPFEITVLNRSEDKAMDRKNKFFKGLEGSLRRGTISQSTFLEKKESLKFTHRLEDLSSTGLIIETAFEDYEEKMNIFRQLESVVNRNTILVTNSSNISIEKLAKGLKYQDRFCGLHFFHPVLLIDLVEIIKWSGTPVDLVEALKDFCLRLDKKAIVVTDGPGSVMNSILAHYYMEALSILEEGLALPSKIDELAKQFYYLGPCESMDVIGIDFLITVLGRYPISESPLPMDGRDSPLLEPNGVLENEREGFFIPYLFDKLVSQGRLGKHVSKGLYLYQKGIPVDDLSDFYINPLRVAPHINIPEGDEHIRNRLLYSIFNGSIRSFKRRKASLEDLDEGVKRVLLMQEGPFSMMRAIGENKLRENFEFLARTVGKRFEQTTLQFLR